MFQLLLPRGAGQRTLTLAFTRPVPSDHWVNRLTAALSKHKVYHTELHFESINQCFSIQLGETAGLRQKTLANPNYQLVSLVVTQKEYDAALEYCRKATLMQLTLDDPGMCRAYWHPCPWCEADSQDTGRTFCTKIITEALKFAGLPEVRHLTPAVTTPSRLLDAVLGSQRQACSSVPFKRHDLVVNGHVPVANCMH